MPRRAPRPCAYAGCPNLVQGPGERYCTDHLRQYRAQQDQSRGTAAERGYGTRWAAIRDRFLRDNPKCERCQRSPATIAHHIIPKRNGGSDDPINLQALCKLCHAQVHAAGGQLFGGRARRGG